MSFTFRKEERLCSKKKIDELFKNSNSFFIYPYKFLWIVSENKTDFPAQIVISVPKKRYKKAVHRNLIKRRIREVYRLNKHILYRNLQRKNITIAAMIIYVGNEIHETSFLEGKLKKVFEKI